MTWVVAAMASALLACSPRVPAVEPIDTAELTWCVRVTVKSERGSPYALAVCAERRDECERLRAMARDRGGLVGIRGVGECR